MLFFVFAIAAWQDQSRASESDRYYQLGGMALSMGSVFEAPRLALTVGTKGRATTSGTGYTRDPFITSYATPVHDVRPVLRRG